MTLGYTYIERLTAPNTVEFYVATPQGHRVVRISSVNNDPRITAFNESNRTRTPAVLFMSELVDLIERAKKLTGVV